MLKSNICSLLNIKYPIFQGGMAQISDAGLAAAVSEAGGLGVIAAGNNTAEALRKEIKKIKDLTDKPFGVNVMLLSPHAKEVGMMLIEEKVPVIITGAGNPGKYMKLWKEAGIKVIPVVPSVAYAKHLEKAGADALICEGTESGGHVGEITTMCITPQVVDAVSVPVVAAGGIGDGRGIAAAFSLGAQGVQVGTRFLLAKECNVHSNYKNKVKNANDTDTAVTGRKTGHPVRVLKNKLVKQFKDLEKNNADVEEMEQLGRGRLYKAAVEGDVDYGSVMSGQIAGLVNKEQCCEEIIEEMFEEAEKIMQELSSLVTGGKDE
ncbi:MULTISPECIES: enoyl-[acyl-carrier-protein] reductase FabK [unclassified Sedimentibacter]|uniref:enoyl-[acyl-carrier-protein] reductase FabK n=1 Tax=unclassified Sedimentibacter TaxID=2649220 RepID=UPI0027DFCA02|nr:enoyl-[acyl-carrier-protein] reductase FabK [Sedimentibacter sp. MB35-C1]WMJ78145.1 enoyl-[acyl-carrier-protein] reductase FabK [Sedimentibacter sp. MB35-C1]